MLREVVQARIALHNPGIEKRVQSILEMLDEFISTNLKNREEAILNPTTHV